VKINLTAPGGTASKVVYGYVVQEIDVATGNALFSWNSLDHVPVEQRPPEPSAGPGSPHPFCPEPDRTALPPR
jgi:hypothetical protein